PDPQRRIQHPGLALHLTASYRTLIRGAAGLLLGRARAEPIAAVIGGLAHVNLGDAGSERSFAAGLDHRRNRILPADEERLDAAVTAVANPAAQPQPGGGFDRPRAIADALHPAGDAQPHAPHRPPLIPARG